MANYPNLNLIGKRPSASFQYFMLQSASVVTDGVGNEITAIVNLSASYAHSASYEIVFEESASHANSADGAISASFASSSKSSSYPWGYSTGKVFTTASTVGVNGVVSAQGIETAASDVSFDGGQLGLGPGLASAYQWWYIQPWKDILTIYRGDQGGAVGQSVNIIPDNIQFLVSSSVVPSASLGFDLGSTALEWNVIHTSQITASAGVGMFGTASNAVTASYVASASFSPVADYTSSLFGTASWANDLKNAKISASVVYLGPTAGSGITKPQAVSIGSGSGAAATNASGAVFIGYQVAYNSAADSGYSVMIGYTAGSYAATSGTSTIIGYQAGYLASTCTNAVILGTNAGFNATSCTNAVFIGNSAGYASTAASAAIIIGVEGGHFATTTTDATMIGSYVGYQATKATNAVMLGRNAGYSATNATNSVMIGYAAGYSATQAGDSTMVGYYAGNTAKTASFVTFVGNLADAADGNLNVEKSIAIGYNAKVSASNTCVIGGVAGGVNAVKVTIGGTTAVNTLDVVGNISCSVITASLVMLPYVTLNTSSTEGVTASFLDSKEYLSIVSAAVYTFTASNMPAANRYANVSLFINNTATNTCSLSFPASWTFIGAVPSALTASKSAYLNLESFGGNVVAGWGVQY